MLQGCDYFLLSGSRYRRAMHMSDTISNDSCGWGQISDWRHQGHDLRSGFA